VHTGRRKHRRPVCTLCQRDIKSRGWTRTVELPPPIVFPAVSDDGDADSGDAPALPSRPTNR
jgi:hypothetical protein